MIKLAGKNDDKNIKIMYGFVMFYALTMDASKYSKELERALPGSTV